MSVFMQTNRCVFLLTCLPLALPSQQKEKQVIERAEEGNSIVLKCNPPQSSMEPIIHWMDWSEYIIFPSRLSSHPSRLFNKSAVFVDPSVVHFYHYIERKS